MDSNNNYVDLIIDVLAETIEYASRFGMELIWTNSENSDIFVVRDLIDNSNEIEFNAQKFNDILAPMAQEDAIITIYNMIYQTVLEVILKKFPKCKELNRLAKNDYCKWEYGASFAHKYTGVKHSRLGDELDIVNLMYTQYEANKDKMPQA